MPFFTRKTPRAWWYDYSSWWCYFITFCTSHRQHYLSDIVDDQVVLTPAGQIVNSCIRQIHDHFSHVDIHDYVVMPNHVHLLLVMDELSNKTACTDTTTACPKNHPLTTTACPGNNININRIAHDAIPPNNSPQIICTDMTTACPHTNPLHITASEYNIHQDRMSNDDKNINNRTAHDAVPTSPTAKPPGTPYGSLGYIINQCKWSATRLINAQIKEWLFTLPYGDSFARQSRYHDHIVRDEGEYQRIAYYIQQNPMKRQKDNFYGKQR